MLTTNHRPAYTSHDLCWLICAKTNHHGFAKAGDVLFTVLLPDMQTTSCGAQCGMSEMSVFVNVINPECRPSVVQVQLDGRVVLLIIREFFFLLPLNFIAHGDGENIWHVLRTRFGCTARMNKTKNVYKIQHQVQRLRWWVTVLLWFHRTEIFFIVLKIESSLYMDVNKSTFMCRSWMASRQVYDADKYKVFNMCFARVIKHISLTFRLLGRPQIFYH